MGARAIAIIGPTACGKTGRAVSLARHLNGEIISADSRQVYRGMTIGTGKDLCEYGDIPYHLIDIRNAGHKYNLHEYLADFHKAYQDILERGKVPVICGGTGMYIENALKGVKLPEVPADENFRASLADKSLEELASMLAKVKRLHNVTDIDTPKRAIRALEIQRYYSLHPDEAKAADISQSQPLDAVVIGIDIPRDDRRKRISKRLKDRLDEGMIDEVKALLDSGLDPADLIYYGLEYKFVTLYLTGAINRKEMEIGLETAIMQFAKRQMTWFRGMEKRGTKIHWLSYNLPEVEFIANVRQILHDQI